MAALMQEISAPATAQHHVLVWGLVGGRVCTGERLAPLDALFACAGAWNPPLLQQQQQQQPGWLPPAAHAVQEVACGWQHSVAARSDGHALLAHTAELLAVGRQHQQQRQQEGDEHVRHPWCWQQLVLPLPRPAAAAGRAMVTKVAAGEAHCLLLTATGTVWALGSSNRHGQLGLSCHQHTSAAAAAAAADDAGQPQHHGGGSSSCMEPLPVLGPEALAGSATNEALQEVAAGACHSAALTAGTGQLILWGWNGHGQCCSGSTEDVLQPRLCAALDGVPLVAVAAGLAHTVCVSRDGAVFACGWNAHGQLGAGHAPAAAAAAAAAAAGKGGGGCPQHTGPSHQKQQQQQLLGGGLESTSIPQLVEHPALDSEHVVKVACGARHTLVLTASGAVWAWGWNKYKQCGCDTPAAAAAAGAGSSAGSKAVVAAEVQLQPRSLFAPPSPQQRACNIYAGRWHSCVECKEA